MYVPLMSGGAGLPVPHDGKHRDHGFASTDMKCAIFAAARESPERPLEHRQPPVRERRVRTLRRIASPAGE